jgi:outer membrane protein assembly factor BamB
MKGEVMAKYALLLSLLVVLVAPALAHDWPSFRGKNASGVADGATPPVTWDVEKNVNVLWKTPIPGVGHSSPVVSGDRVFITTAISSDPAPVFQRGPSATVESAKDVSKHQWRLYCLDRLTGRVMWHRTAREGVPRVKRHVKASFATPTPATDGERVVAFFGSEGLYCYEKGGALLWKQDVGLLDGGWTPDPNSHWGFASSPVIYKHLVILQCDSQNVSFIAAYDIKDGRRVWHVPRNEDTCWATPTIYEGRSGAELIVSGTKHYRGYDPLTGRELWRLSDGADVKIPTPVVANDMFYLGGGSSHMKRVFYAVRAGARGDITLAGEQTSSSHIAWRNRAVPHILTPLVLGDHLYVCSDNGVLAVYDAKTGKQVYLERIAGRSSAFSASPVASDGKIYFSSEDGDVFVVKAGAEYELLARNAVGEAIMATPAISGNMIIVRGQKHIFALKEKNHG